MIVHRAVASGQYAYDIHATMTAGQFPARAFLFDGDADDVGNPPLAFFAAAVLAAIGRQWVQPCRAISPLLSLH